MYPFWEMVIAPVVKAAGGHRVLEIGALRGETTAKMFEQLGPNSELHVIDPLPQFDPAEHELEFPGRYVFHQDLSLNVLGDLPPFDVALIDGDHNWYTVYHELQHLQATADEAGQPIPVLIMHDVGWPYGHRDLYYEPSQIPEEFRQPYRHAGIAPGFHRVLGQGGMNAELANAIDGGGPRNGVRCALDDFLETYERPYRLVELPFYFGLAIVVDEARLDATPKLAKVLDGLESSRGRERMLKLSERIRLDAAVHEHNWNRTLEGRADRHRDRYLKLLTDALLDRHYLDNEVRLSYIASLGEGASAPAEKLRDPPRTLEVRFKRMAQAREAGRSTDAPSANVLTPYSDSGRAALDHLRATIATLADAGVAGDVVECGVGRGGAGILARACLDAYDLTDRNVWMVDPFLATGDVDDPEGEAAPGDRDFLRADLNVVRDGFDRFDLLDGRVRFLQGIYEAALTDAPIEKISLLRIGLDAAYDIRSVLSNLLPRMADGATVVVEGVGRPIVERRLTRFREGRNVGGRLERIDWNTVAWTVEHQRSDEHAAEGFDRQGDTDDATTSMARTPLAPPSPGEPLALSVVVVFYDMAREAVRTLQSLSRTYQRDIDDLDYEVIVIDNGSHEDQRLTQDQVSAYGPEFRLITLDDAKPSPTVALNRGIDESRGRAVAVMIDGAHVLTPGVFRHAMAAMDTYEPAVVAIQQWYVGPGQQGDAQQAGYDQTAEDRLFRTVRWPTDGYRLFEIGHFIGDRDWFDGIIESNCLFAPRALLEQVGGFDDAFDVAGGGYANLELFERLHAHPGVNPVSVLGEGTFHQFHGGTTTNVADEAIRRDRVVSYGDDFAKKRGRGLNGLNKPVHYVGAMDTKAARRTRSRREILLAFAPDRNPVTSTVAEPVPVADELKFAAIEALWNHQAWRQATWLGHPVNRYPTDLHAYQELMAEHRADWVIWVGEDEGLAGRALLSATIADQIGHGQVLAIGPVGSTPPAHPRITYLDGDPARADLTSDATSIVGDSAALVFVGLGAPDRVLGAFEAFSSLVPVGGHFVVENTVVNGRPVEPGFGAGPHEAVSALLREHPEFVSDMSPERYTVTFNKHGYLRRTAAP